MPENLSEDDGTGPTRTLPMADRAVVPVQIIGGYSLIRVLGRGGMGEVHLARHRMLGREVALKVLRAELAEDGAFVERFLREARLAATLDHPRLVRVHDAWQDNERVVLAQEFVPGGDCNALVQRAGRLPEDRALRIIRDAAEGLAVMHRAGLIHRDIKPANLLLGADGRVKVGDFGLARPAIDDEQLTSQGVGVGTPSFMAPEQLSASQDLDHRLDIYALGATCFALCAGQAPFRGTAPMAIAARILKGDLPDLAAMAPGISAATVDLVRRCMAVDRSQRPADTHALMADIDRILQQPLTATRGTSLDGRAPTGTGATSAVTVVRRRLLRRDALWIWPLALAVAGCADLAAPSPAGMWAAVLVLALMVLVVAAVWFRIRSRALRQAHAQGRLDTVGLAVELTANRWTLLLAFVSLALGLALVTTLTRQLVLPQRGLLRPLVVAPEAPVAARARRLLADGREAWDRGESIRARQHFDAWAALDQPGLDAHIDYAKVVAYQDGKEAAVADYRRRVEAGGGADARATLATLLPVAQRAATLDLLLADHPEYAPAWLLRAEALREESPNQMLTVDAMRRERELLERFAALDAQGQLARHFTRPAATEAWRQRAANRAKAAAMQRDAMQIDRPIVVLDRALLQPQPWQWYLLFEINTVEWMAMTDLRYRIDEGPWRSTGTVGEVNPSLGHAMVANSVLVPYAELAGRHRIHVAYTDNRGREREVPSLEFDGAVERSAIARRGLAEGGRQLAVVAERDPEAQTVTLESELVFFADSYAGLAGIRIGIGDGPLDRQWPGPWWQGPGSPPGEDEVTLPAATSYRLQVVFADGTASAVETVTIP